MGDHSGLPHLAANIDLRRHFFYYDRNLRVAKLSPISLRDNPIKLHGSETDRRHVIKQLERDSPIGPNYNVLIELWDQKEFQLR